MPKNPYVITAFALIALLLIATPLQAQRNKKDKKYPTEGYLNVGMHLGGAYYLGDIYAGVGTIRPTLGVHLGRKLSPHVHGRISLNYAYLMGDDSQAADNTHTYARNLHFRNQITELQGQLLIELRSSQGKFHQRTNFSPYIGVGLTLFHHNPQAKSPWGGAYRSRWVDLQPLGTEGQGRWGYPQPYSKTQIALPFSLGIRWKAHDRLDVMIEVCFRYTYTDYLDDTSGQYPPLSDLGSPLAIALANRTLESRAATTGKERNLALLIEKYGISNYLGADNNLYATLAGFQQDSRFYRGNALPRDFYLTAQLQLAYIVNVGLKCPKFK